MRGRMAFLSRLQPVGVNGAAWVGQCCFSGFQMPNITAGGARHSSGAAVESIWCSHRCATPSSTASHFSSFPWKLKVMLDIGKPGEQYRPTLPLACWPLLTVAQTCTILLNVQRKGINAYISRLTTNMWRSAMESDTTIPPLTPCFHIDFQLNMYFLHPSTTHMGASKESLWRGYLHDSVWFQGCYMLCTTTLPLLSVGSLPGNSTRRLLPIATNNKHLQN